MNKLLVAMGGCLLVAACAEMVGAPSAYRLSSRID